MESNVNYQDPAPNKVITKKDLTKMIWRSLLLQASFNYERMQACGWLYGLLPGLKKIHKNKKDLSDSMKDHMGVFNTHPLLVTFIMGLVLSMEENKEDRNIIRSIKIATMGPLGGIGDALLWLTALPICLGIAAPIAKEGNFAGPILFLLMFNALHFFLRFFLMTYGYNAGVKAISNLREQTKKISHAASIVGLTVIGGLIADSVKLKTAMIIPTGNEILNIQEGVLDKILLNLLPLAYTFLMYKLLKKGYSPVKLILITVIFGIIAKYIEMKTGIAIFV